jgi:3-hydroxyisobutyrate dehydrogenase
MQIAIVGCGEVGILYAGALRSFAERLYLFDPTPSPKATLFSQQTGVVLSSGMDYSLRRADTVLSCVVGTKSREVALTAFSYMRKGAIFADLTSCDPADIRTAAALAAENGIRYVDIAIMGPVALDGIRTALVCAGTSSDELAAMFQAVGAPARVLTEATAGDASALKILRSIFLKGLEALAIETFLAAEQQGMTDQLYDVLADIDNHPLRVTLECLVRTHLKHAPRRLREIEEAERLLLEAGIPVAVLHGVRTLFERTCGYLKQDPIHEAPATAEEAFDWLAANAKRELEAEKHQRSPSNEVHHGE